MWACDVWFILQVSTFWRVRLIWKGTHLDLTDWLVLYPDVWFCKYHQLLFNLSGCDGIIKAKCEQVYISQRLSGIIVGCWFTWEDENQNRGKKSPCVSCYFIVSHADIIKLVHISEELIHTHTCTYTYPQTTVMTWIFQAQIEKVVLAVNSSRFSSLLKGKEWAEEKWW